MKKMKAWISLHKKASLLIAASVFCLIAAVAAGVILVIRSSTESTVYKETTVKHGKLTVGVTEDGTVSVGTVEQSFALDISEYTSGNNNMSFNPMRGMGQNGGSSDSSSSRSLEVEEVYASVGEQVNAGDKLFKLTDSSVADIREQLAADESEAKLAYDKLLNEQKKTSQDASHTYEQNQVYGTSAAAEYEEALYDLNQAVDDAKEALEDAEEDLADYQSDLEEVQADYEEAKKYLTAAEYAVEGDNETYWYLKNEESREQAQKTVDDEEDKIEELSDNIRDKQQEMITLKKAYDEALAAYQTGEADAKTQYDKRVLNLNKAGEIYGIATDEIEYSAKVAKEDYEDASEKLQDFDSYIVDGIVSAEYDGVITGVSIESGDKIENDSAIVTLNNFEDITVSVDVSDDDMKEIAVGDTVNLYFAAFPEGNFAGKVSDIGDATIDSNSSITYAVEITVDGDVSGLYEGMTGEVTFITKETKEVTYVSNRSIIREGTKSYVKMKDESGKIVKKEVQTGFSDGNSVEIKEGLLEGDVVLIESKVKSE